MRRNKTKKVLKSPEVPKPLSVTLYTELGPGVVPHHSTLIINTNDNYKKIYKKYY